MIRNFKNFVVNEEFDRKRIFTAIHNINIEDINLAVKSLKKLQKIKNINDISENELDREMSKIINGLYNQSGFFEDLHNSF